jgi:predicted peroxiredoxin
MTTPTRSLVIKATSGADRPETVNQAFTVSGTGESAWLALPGRTEDVALDQAAPLGDLLAVVLDAGTVTVCTQCAARRGFGPDDVVPGIRIAGAAVFVEEILAAGAQALVY